MTLFIVSDLINILLATFFLIDIICSINSKGHGTRSTTIGVFFLFLLSPIFLFLLLSFVGDPGIPFVIRVQDIG